MQCPNCGGEMNAGYSRCVNCGGTVSYSQDVENSDLYRKIGWIIVILTLLFLGAWSVYFPQTYYDLGDWLLEQVN